MWLVPLSPPIRSRTCHRTAWRHILFRGPTVGNPVLFETLLHPVEQVLINNSRNAARRHNVLVAVFADVAAVMVAPPWRVFDLPL